MINEILQFIKKTILSIKLARGDVLFLLEGLKPFRFVLPQARLWKKKSRQPLCIRIRSFLDAEQSVFLDIAAEEVGIRSDVADGCLFTRDCGEDRLLSVSEPFRSAAVWQKKDVFYRKLWDEIARNDSRFILNGTVYKKRMDNLNDMRFYASELEILNQKTSGSPYSCPFEVDWIRTGKRELYLNFGAGCRFTSVLSKKEQESLAAVWGYMFFAGAVFISFWRGVLADAAGRVAFPDFDCVCEADWTLKNFAAEYIRGHALPQRENEFRLERALKLLRHYCPDINPFDFWKNYLNTLLPKEIGIGGQKSLLANLSRNGVVTPPAKKLHFPAAADLAYLLDSRRHKNDPRFRKSGVLYWGPLLLVIYLLFKYF